MTEWTQLAWLALSFIVAAVLITFGVSLVHYGREINDEISRQEATKLLMQDVRKYNPYSDKVVYAQDVISLIMETRGEVAVRILSGTAEDVWYCDQPSIMEALQVEPAVPWRFEPAKEASVYTVSAVTATVDINKRYLGYLDKGINGEIIGVTFKKGTVDAGGVFHE